jgi:Sugar (and other) transporter
MISIYGSLVILAFVNPIALENIGWHYYIVFCCLLVLIFATTWFLFPETKGELTTDIKWRQEESADLDIRTFVRRNRRDL